MPFLSKYLQRALLAGLVFGCGCGFAAAQDAGRPGAQSLTIPVIEVDGHLIINTTFYDQAGSTEAISLELSLDTPGTIEMHGDEYGWLKIDEDAVKKGTPVNVKVAFADGSALLFPSDDVKPGVSGARADIQNAITRFFPAQINERKVKGLLGLGFLRNYHVILDLAAGKLVLTPATPAGAAPAPVGDYAGKFDSEDGVLKLSAASPTGTPVTVVLGSSYYDTLIDPAVAKKLGHPAGDIGSVTLKGAAGLDLSSYVAFRPQAFDAKPAAGAEAPLLVSGVGLLDAFRLEIDWGSSTLALTRQKLAQNPDADRSYFLARAAGTADGYQAFMKAHPDSRLASEAAGKLIELRLGEAGASDADVLQALQWVIDAAPSGRRTEICLDYVKRIAAMKDRTELCIQAALLGLKYSRDAITIQDVYRTHRILGDQYLIEDELPTAGNENYLDLAWTHFMSAAFMPVDKDAEQAFYIQYGLARVYDRQGRAARAYSRYKVAFDMGGPPDVHKAIGEAMARLKAKISPEQLRLLDS